MGQLPHDLPDFRQLSSAERSKLAEAIWERFVATHPESAGRASGEVQEFARPDIDGQRSSVARSLSEVRAQRSATTQSGAPQR